MALVVFGVIVRYGSGAVCKTVVLKDQQGSIPWGPNVPRPTLVYLVCTLV